jgi:hypothetical protein
MAGMGRRRSTHHGLPPHMAQKGRSYYYVTNDKPRRWIPLGNDYREGARRMGEARGPAGPTCARTFSQVGALYMVDVNKGVRNSPRARRRTRRDLARLKAVFGESAIETIKPVDVTTYLAGRQVERGQAQGRARATVRANREISLLSHIVNWARGIGLTDGEPMRRHRQAREPGRGRYLEDAEFDAIYAAGDELLRDAMDLLSSTSQRPGDVVKMKRAQLRDGALWARQGKTGTPQRFQMEGDLKAAVDRMTTRPREADSVYLVADCEGPAAHVLAARGPMERGAREGRRDHAQRGRRSDARHPREDGDRRRGPGARPGAARAQVAGDDRALREAARRREGEAALRISDHVPGIPIVRLDPSSERAHLAHGPVDVVDQALDMPLKSGKTSLRPRLNGLELRVELLTSNTSHLFVAHLALYPEGIMH